MRKTSGGTYLAVGPPQIRCDTYPKHSLLLVGIEAEIITADVITADVITADVIDGV
jgi:hypothetical protein